MKIGVDWGGTKIEAVINAHDKSEVNRLRIDSPQDNYETIIQGIVRFNK